MWKHYQKRVYVIGIEPGTCRVEGRNAEIEKKRAVILDKDQSIQIDLEICRYIHGHFATFGNFDAAAEIVELIGNVGIRGHYLPEEHTLLHFRENWFPQIFDRTIFTFFEESRNRDIYHNAHDRVKRLLASKDFWEIDGDRSKEITDFSLTKNNYYDILSLLKKGFNEKSHGKR